MLEASVIIMKEELLKGLTEEQIAKVKACKNSQEMLAVAREEGIELTDEQLEAVNGGCGTTTFPFCCSKCGSNQLKREPCGEFLEKSRYTCSKCGHYWEG